MPDTDRIVINTGPIIAIVAALGDLYILQSLYRHVLVPYEVCQEIMAGGQEGYAIAAFEKSSFLQKYASPIEVTSFLKNSLDPGEAAVIQLAINEKVQTVSIDEAVGRRVARLNGLKLTGSVGILLKAKQKGHPIIMKKAIQRMKEQGIWLSESVIRSALKLAGEE